MYQVVTKLGMGDMFENKNNRMTVFAVNNSRFEELQRQEIGRELEAPNNVDVFKRVNKNLQKNPPLRFKVGTGVFFMNFFCCHGRSFHEGLRNLGKLVGIFSKLKVPYSIKWKYTEG